MAVAPESGTMLDSPCSHLAPVAGSHPQQAQSHLRQRLYGMKHVCCCYPAASAPVEVLDSSSMETKPLRMRQAR